MRIENRRSHLETIVTKEEWSQMVDQQTSKLFKVIDKDENTIKRINIPRQIEEFKVARVERISVNVDHNDTIKQGEIMADMIEKTKPIKK